MVKNLAPKSLTSSPLQ